MNREFLRKNKKVILISCGVLIVVLAFLLKKNSTYKNSNVAKVGLVYDNETIGDLVNRDTDGDGVTDWEEGLWGTDPKNPDTLGNGLGDAVEIAKMKQASGETTGNTATIAGNENLTETDKFSRELFTSVAALDQTGGMDQDTVDKLSASVVSQISEPAVKTTFTSSDIKTVQDSSVQAAKKYSDALDSVFKKSPTLFQNGYEGVAYQVGKGFEDAMQAFDADDTGDASELASLDPLIQQVQSLNNGIISLSTPVPGEFTILHLNVINSFERIIENMNGLKLLDSDPVVAMGAASKFADNMDALQAAISQLETAISNKINN